VPGIPFSNKDKSLTAAARWQTAGQRNGLTMDCLPYFLFIWNKRNQQNLAAAFACAATALPAWRRQLKAGFQIRGSTLLTCHPFMFPALCNRHAFLLQHGENFT
jgi:hypothetical protein